MASHRDYCPWLVLPFSPSSPPPPPPPVSTGGLGCDVIADSSSMIFQIRGNCPVAGLEERRWRAGHLRDGRRAKAGSSAPGVVPERPATRSGLDSVMHLLRCRVVSATEKERWQMRGRIEGLKTMRSPNVDEWRYHIAGRSSKLCESI